jgi:hypothetical protein
VSTPLRLALFGTVLVALFGISFVVAGAVVPDRVVADWERSVTTSTDHTPDGHTPDAPGPSTADHGG